ncbi:DUF998 domain-containing protein [Cnuibacter physcomitrellae]|uniref:DUF998 domain-containing protein n=1 Tax=Cnuibacter physcomitrellae TaxID=1619308 RepID=UPI002175B033|nr:DUF998 domain-containing protein [Cnuibacter physcomitrellae]MCS5496442.1 DUF998 domain-containing protein [Cnuibacter physcomitrellae]
MSATTEKQLDTAAAVTRSMLGWGVVAGPFYLVFGLVLAVTRPGFDLGSDALSILLLGELGWLQATNLILSGLMVIVAAVGLSRTPGFSRVAAVLVGVYGLGLIASAFAAPDRPGTGSASVSGVLHLVFGAVGFLALGVAALVAVAWFRRRNGASRPGTGGAWSLVAGVVVLVAFTAGGALSGGPAGVLLLWLAVLVGWAWLAATSVAAYRTVPHPLLSRR